MTTLSAVFPHRDLFVHLFADQVYLVGGSVRDLVMGRESPDWDVLVAGSPVDVLIERLRPYGRVDCVGRSFGVVKFTTAHGAGAAITYDVSLPRTDSLMDPHARNHRNFFVRCDPSLPIEADLNRRDFRMNSMAIRLSDGLLIDPFGGTQDIADRCIRVTNPATFVDDPLRVIRLARFSATLDFAVDPALYELCKDVDVLGLSVERISEELIRMMLRSRAPGNGMKELLKLGVLRQLFHEIYAMALCLQDSVFHPEADEYGHHTVFHHTTLVMNQARALSDLFQLDTARRLVLQLTALLHDVAKPNTTAWEYKHGRLCLTSVRHDILGEQMAEQFLKRFRIYSYEGFDLQRLVGSLVRTHLRPQELWGGRANVTRKAFGRLAADVHGETDLLVLFDQADRAGRHEEAVTAVDARAEWLFEKFREYAINRETLQPLVRGRDLLSIGFSPGRAMGQVLRELHDMQIDGVFDSRERGVELAGEVSLRLFGSDRC